MAPSRGLFDLGALPYDLLTSQRLWAEQVQHLLQRTLPAGPPVRRALDLGCGPGVSAEVLADALPAARVVALDLSPGMLRRARRRLGRHPRIQLCAGDGGRLPLAEGALDLVIGHSFLYLVPDPAAVLREVARVLRPGGALGLLEPAATGSLRRAAWSSLGAWPRAGRRPLSALRFASSMVVWRVFSGRVGRLDPGVVRGWFHAAGLEQVTISPALGGLGLHCVATRAACSPGAPGPLRPTGS